MDYSVIIPVYNSEGMLEELSNRLVVFFENTPAPPSESPPKREKKPVSYELIFVDDFSKDDSWEVLKKLKKKQPETIKIIRLAKNYGQHNATFCGFQYAKGNYNITIDDDLQNAPEDIGKLIGKIKTGSFDLVYGMKGKEFTNNLQKGARKLYKFNSKRLEKGFGEGSSFRIFTKSLVQKTLSHGQYFMFIDELFFWYTHHIGFVEVPYHKRVSGKSGYSLLKIFKILKNNTLLYGSWPLKLMVYIGSVFSLITFLIGVFYIAKKLFFGISVPGFTAIIVTILFSTSIILLCFGILGNYLKNIHVLLNKKPAYSIKEER